MGHRHRPGIVGGVACVVVATALVVTAVSAEETQVRVIPSIALSQRYDSNVFFIDTGDDLSDYVTSVSPSVMVEHKSRYLSGTEQITLLGETFAKNPGLNYAAVTGSFNLSLDQLMAKLDRRLRLSVNDYVTYTPQPPAFYAPPVAGGAAAATASAPENFIRGIQGVRANSLINVAGASGIYDYSPSIGLASSFSHQYMRFGTTFADVPGQGFFTTSFLNLTAGPQYRPSSRDTLSLNFQYSSIAFSQGDQFSSGFELQGATLGWRRALNQKVTAEAVGGVTIFSPGGDLQYLASASLIWRERNTDTTVSYTRSIFPSFFIAALPLLSQVISVNVAHRFTERLGATLSGNYARNESTPDPLLVFDSYAASASLNYGITRNLSASLNYTHMQMTSSFFGEHFGFDRDMFSLTLYYQWR